MEGCIFCKIASEEFQSAKIWEDENHVAFLDINPNMVGMTLVIPKKHFDSYTFKMPDEDHHALIDAAKKTSEILEKALNVKRVAMVMEGLGVNHAHIKLYPINGLDEKFKDIWSKKRVFFEMFEGYITTELGPQRSMEELQALAEEIKKRAK